MKRMTGRVGWLWYSLSGNII